MIEKMHKHDLQEFLQSYRDTSETIILSEAKQKNELLEIAKKKGIIVKDSMDLAVFKTVYTFAEKANDNKEMTRKNELLKALPTLIGKPINIDHIRRYIVGYYIDYRYVEKQNKVIAYGIFFKNAFDKEWGQVQKLFKSKKLATSHEIWSNKKKDEILPDGTVVLHQLQMAGGAILLKTIPAFKDAKVLSMSAEDQRVINRVKENLENMIENKSEDYQLVYACTRKDGLCKLGEEDKELHVAETVIKTDTGKTLTDTGIPQVPQGNVTKAIVCSHCGCSFEKELIMDNVNEIDCPNCFAVLDNEGKMKFPPQILKFSLTCPDCKSRNNWRTLDFNDNKASVRCKNCAKEYELSFKEESGQVKLIQGMTFLRSGSVACLQCGISNPYYVHSSSKIIAIKCKKCGMKFTIEPTNFEDKKQIETIKELRKSKQKEENLLELSEEEIEELEKERHVAKKLTYEERKNLPDSSFAVVVTVKNKITGKPRKIRKYPVQDEAHVRNALARIAQPQAQEELKKLGVSVKATIKKILKRAKKLGLTELLKRSKKMNRALLKKAVTKIREAKKEAKLAKASLETQEKKVGKFVGGIKKFAKKFKNVRDSKKELELSISSLKEEIESTKKFYMDNAKEIAKRQASLEGYDHDLSEKDIMEDAKYELAVAKKKITELEKEEPKVELKTASMNVGDEPEPDMPSDDYYKEKKAEINKVAGIK